MNRIKCRGLDVEPILALYEFYNRNAMGWSSYQKTFSHGCIDKDKAQNRIYFRKTSSVKLKKFSSILIMITDYLTYSK